MHLQGKKVLLGVSGSIAAYKAALLIRIFIKSGAEVKVIMTKDAKEFIGSLTLSTLSKNPVLTDFFKQEGGEWSNHVELGLWADFMLIAPATANTIAKMANGICDNLLLAAYLSARCPVYIAPAMDMDMYKHPATVANINKLSKIRNIIIPAENGELASGLTGVGRMNEPENIVSFIENHFFKKGPLTTKTAIVTAGPTYEKIDDVRFIGNFSSGKMGYAIAEKLCNAGANVILISGPTAIEISGTNIKKIEVQSADEMYDSVMKYFESADITVMSAAVADFKPKTIVAGKIKKEEAQLNIELEKTKDILGKLGSIKRKNQILVGFALESSNGTENAKRKLKSKNLDFIVLNSLQNQGAGFGVDTNKITIFDKNGEESNFELKPKTEVAKDIVNEIINLINV